MMTSSAESQDALPRAPEQLGHYVVEGELGRGGMGVVFLARDPKLDRQVAIKTLPAELARDPEQLGRFEREAKLLASLNHPNIATIHGLEETADSTRYLILERVEGETLADRLLRGKLPFDEAIRVCEQVADALEAAHERGVIHRDLKPRNIMITPAGRVKVLDFGLAKRSGPERPASAQHSMLTEPGIMMGTPGYMSPEQILAQPQDVRTDVFAFGCVLFETLAGHKAFESESVHALVALVLSGEPSWSQLPGEAPSGVRHLIGRCIEKDPDQRFANMHDVRKALRALVQEHAAGHTTTMASMHGTLHNLPREVASFVGRERELEECGRLLGQTRLLTMTGSGGSGKTRLALRLAAGLVPTHSGGVWFVDLGPLSDAGGVPHAIAQALDVREESGRTLERGLTDRLSGPPALLVLDNCEHVLATCGPLADSLLQVCENLKVIATSREALGVAGEQVYAVPTLAVPEKGIRLTPERLAGYASARLFAERALQVQPSFHFNGNCEAVADICRRLDGIPLAIELAAARVKVLAVEQIRAKLDDRFRLLTGGSKAALPRQQTLRATIQWSYDHLHTEEQALMRALSAFSGGWTLEAATAVCGVSDDEFEVLDLLTRLVDKSLVVVEHPRGGDTRYRYLETVRQYSVERLNEAGEANPVRDRHLGFYAALAEQAEEELRGPRQPQWLQRLRLEHENMLAAIGRCDGGAQCQPELTLRLAGAVWRFWLMAGHLGLGRRLLGELLAINTGSSPVYRAKAIYGQALLAFTQGDFAAARAGVDQCLPIYRELADGDRVAACLGMLGNIASEEGDFAAARAKFEEALDSCRHAKNSRGIATHLNNLGVLAWRQRDLDGARAMFDEAAGFMHQLGDSDSLAHVLGNLANIAAAQGDLAGAKNYLLAGLKIILELGVRRPGRMVLEVASDVAALSGDPTRAVTLRGAADALRELLGMPFGHAERQAQEDAVSALREELGGSFLEAWEAGREKSLEEALQYTLAWLEAGVPARQTH